MLSALKYVLFKILKKFRGVAIRNSVVHPSAKLESGSAFINSSMDRHSFCGYDCSLLNVDVGPFSSIASKVSIGGAAHPMHFVSTSPVFLSHKDSVKTKYAHHDYLPIVQTMVGADVWIGEGVFVKAGVTIGNGAVIGMGAVVTKDIPPYAIVAGSPAKIINYRFDQNIIDNLLTLKWWEFDDAKLMRLGKYIHSPAKFIEEAERL